MTLPGIFKPETWHPEPALRSRFVCLVGCGKAKLNRPAKASELYTGGLTRVTIAWARRNCETFFILSAKFGLLHPDKVIEPYNVKMSDLDAPARERWGRKVRKQLPPGRLLILAGGDYVKALALPSNRFVELLHGLGMFERTKWFKNHPYLTTALLEQQR